MRSEIALFNAVIILNYVYVVSRRLCHCCHDVWDARSTAWHQLTGAARVLCWWAPQSPACQEIDRQKLDTEGSLWLSNVWSGRETTSYALDSVHTLLHTCTCNTWAPCVHVLSYCIRNVIAGGWLSHELQWLYFRNPLVTRISCATVSILAPSARCSTRSYSSRSSKRVPSNNYGQWESHNHKQLCDT